MSNTTTPSQGPVTHPVHRSVTCWRCGGLLLKEHCMDLDTGQIGTGYWARRCIQCGDMTDETILHNRYALRQTPLEIGPAAGRGQVFAASRLMVEKEGDMPRYLMPLLRSGVMRACGPPLRHAKARWLWLSILRWVGLSQRGRTSDLPVRH
jgi:hypothetical protein